MRIIVIMPSYLGQYPNCAKDREKKFVRAVKSFRDQEYSDKKLIIISDGCEKTVNMLAGPYKIFYPAKDGVFLNSGDIGWYQMPKKSDLFSGAVRNTGLSMAGISAPGPLSPLPKDVICYLDTDDYLFPRHLTRIAQGFADPALDWAFFDDFVAEDSTLTKYRTRENVLKEGRVGTSSIAHRLTMGARWPDGYGHDWKFIESLMAESPNFKKIPTPGYLVCHIPGQTDY